jgi:hypothetical protein
VSIYTAAVVGALTGFLWFNCYPAEVFMGDTGSLSLGGTTAAVCILTKHELMFLIVGGIFLYTAISTFIQDVVGLKFLGQRMQYRAPAHHKYQHLGLRRDQGDDALLDREPHVRPSRCSACVVGIPSLRRYEDSDVRPPADPLRALNILFGDGNISRRDGVRPGAFDPSPWCPKSRRRDTVSMLNSERRSHPSTARVTLFMPLDNHPLHDAIRRAIGRCFPPMRRCDVNADAVSAPDTRRAHIDARSHRATPSVLGFDAPPPTWLKDHP